MVSLSLSVSWWWNPCRPAVQPDPSEAGHLHEVLPREVPGKTGAAAAAAVPRLLQPQPPPTPTAAPMTAAAPAVTTTPLVCSCHASRVCMCPSIHLLALSHPTSACQSTHPPLSRVSTYCRNPPYLSLLDIKTLSNETRVRLIHALCACLCRHVCPHHQTLEIFGWKWWWPTLDDDEMKAVQSVPQANGR